MRIISLWERFLLKQTFGAKQGGCGAEHCLVGALVFSQNDSFENKGLRCGTWPRGAFFHQHKRFVFRSRFGSSAFGSSLLQDRTNVGKPPT